MLTPLHQLATQNDSPDYNICHDGDAYVSRHAFIKRIRSQVAVLTSRKEQRWLLVNDSPLDFAVLMFALLHANKQVVIPPNGLPGTLSQLADAYDAVVTESLPTDVGVDNRALSALDVDAVSIVLYTSGSTGVPKAVPKQLRQLEAEIAVLEALWGKTLGQATVIATVPHHHIYGLLFRVLWPLAAGRVFDAVTCNHPEDIETRALTFDRTILVSSPSQLARLPKTALTSQTPRPRMVFSSGGALTAAAAAHATQVMGSALVEVLGSTETGGIAWRCQAESDAWIPLPSIQLHLNASALPSQPVLHSPFLFDAEPVLMDDLIEWLPNQTFRLCGRADKVVKVEQKRLSLTELEQLLTQHAWIAHAAALVVSGRRESVAVVTVLNASGREALLHDGRNALIKVFRQHLAAHFEAVLLPRYWRFVEALPVNSVGKTTQAQLLALFENINQSSEVINHAAA